MRRRTALVAVVAGGSIAVGTLIGLTNEDLAGGSSTPPTTRGPAGGVSEPGTTSPTALAVAEVLPAGSEVRSARAVKAGAADYEQVEAEGVAGAFEVTVYNKFDPSEFDGFGLKATMLADGTVWTESGSRERSATIYFLSSGGVGLRIAHHAAPGQTTSAASLEGMAKRLAPLVG